MNRKMTFREICEEKCRAKEEFVRKIHEATGVNIATVYRWVKGLTTPSYRDQKSIADALGSTVEFLFGKA